MTFRSPVVTPSPLLISANNAAMGLPLLLPLAPAAVAPGLGRSASRLPGGGGGGAAGGALRCGGSGAPAAAGEVPRLNCDTGRPPAFHVGPAGKYLPQKS